MFSSFSGVSSVAYKELLHIVRDRRILFLVIVLPPLLTLIFGSALEQSDATNIPVSFEDRDQSPQSQDLLTFLTPKKTFQWQPRPAQGALPPNLLREKVDGSLIIPAGWGTSLSSGTAAPLQLYVDGGDTSTGDQLNGAIQEALGEFQHGNAGKQIVMDGLPVEVFDLAEKLPPAVRDKLNNALDPWPVKTAILYNPHERFIDYAIPGIIGLILQLLTVTLMACTVTRERESGTLYQLMVTSLRRSEIVLGKVLPYLVLSIFLILTSALVASLYFETKFQRIGMLSLICFLFLCCSLGLGLLISAFCHTQAQAIQVAVFYLLPVFPLSGAFLSLAQLPPAIQLISQTFPLTHFCHAFRLVNLYDADFSFFAGDLLFLFFGALVCCAGAAFLLRRIQE